MKEEMLNLVKELKDDDINLVETPVKFIWGYKEEPLVTFTLVIDEKPPVEELH